MVGEWSASSPLFCPNPQKEGSPPPFEPIHVEKSATSKVEARRDMRGPDLLDVRLLWRAAIGAGTDSRARRDRAILACLFDLGLRRTELCNLDRVDVEAGPRGTPPAGSGCPAAIWIRGKGRIEKERMTLPDQTAAALVEWIEARGNESGPLFHRLDGRPLDPDVRLSGESVRRIVRRLAKAAACPGTFAPMACDTARQHQPSMLAAISATSGDSPAIDHWRWSYGMTTCGGMLPGRLPAIWPPGGTRDAKYKDHAMRGRKPKPTALKLLDGTRADRINHDEPAMPPA